MSKFTARWVLPITMALAGVEPAGAILRAFSPTGSPNRNLISEPPAQGTATEGLVLQWVKVLAVSLALLLLAWRIWSIIRNTDAWRNLNALGGENPAAEADDEVAADNDRLLENHPHADLELTNRPASRHRSMQPLPGFPNMHDEGRSQGHSGPYPGTTFTRVSTWTSSSMSIHESHNSQPPFTRNC